MFKLKILGILFLLVTSSVQFINCADEELDAETKQLLVDHCPEFWHYITSCQSAANSLEDRQKKLKEGKVYQAFHKLESTKAEYEKLQKQVDDCKKKSTSKCKDSAIKTYAALTQMNDYISQIMSTIHSKNSKMPEPIKKTEKVDEGISYTIVTNFNKDQFDTLLTDFIVNTDADSTVLDKISDTIDKIEDVTKSYNTNNDILQKCLNTASSDCSKVVGSAYNSFNEMNLAIESLMNELHAKYPDIMPTPKKETQTIDTYLVHKVTNFDTNALIKALNSYGELMIPNQILKNLEICKKNLEDKKSKCENHLKDYFGGEVPIQYAGLGVNFAATMGGMYAIEAGIAAAGGPAGILVSSVLIGITFIPAVSDAIDEFSDWVARGIFGKKEDTSYYKEFLLGFEEPIKKDTLAKAKRILKEKIEKAKKIAQDKISKSEQSKKDTIPKDTISKSKDSIVKETLGKK